MKEILRPGHVRVEINQAGDVLVDVNGQRQITILKGFHVEIISPHQEIRFTQKHKPIKQTPKQKRDEEWEMENLMPREEPKQEHDEIMREVLGKEEGEPLE